MKKQNNFNFLGIVVSYILPYILIIFLIIFMFSFANKPTERFCRQNPDQCVCEEWKYKCAQDDRQLDNGNCIIEEGINGTPNYIFDFEPDNKCLNFHKKTTKELAIDDCNNNPREDEKCKCLDKKERYCYSSASWNESYIPYNTTIKIRTTLPQSCIPDLEKYYSLIDYDRNVIESTCIQSQPKTPCEKGNPDWVWRDGYE